MCGIAGILGLGNLGVQHLERMLKIQGHRGPDGFGNWISKDRRICLGHRRLSILDLSDAGAQPMVDTTGRFVLTYNGEIYNYLELRAELEKLGVIFRSRTDTEVVLEAYKHWGEACLDRFNGMFAFALYDQPRGKLFCARDRYGEKPFLFTTRGDKFAFASEYKALLLLDWVSAEYNHLTLIQFSYQQGAQLDGKRQTVFNDIQQLLPGESMSLDIRTLNCRIRQYWEVQLDPLLASITDAEAQERFRELVVDSVKLRMRSDVPVGSCLSGGLDSSAIVAIARELLGDAAEYHTFTGRFPGTPQDEWAYAKVVIENYGAQAHVVEPTPEQFIDDLPDFIWHNELPVGSASQFAQWCVFRLAKEIGVTVLLDGQGADELLGGYEQIFVSYVATLKEQGKTDLLRDELPDIKKRYPLALTPVSRGIRDRLPFKLRRFIAHHTAKGSSLLFGMKQEWVASVREAGRIQIDEKFNTLSNHLKQESFGRFLTTLLRYGDRNSMAHSREVRLPFCDHRLPELIFSLPPEYIMGEAQTKRMMRKSLARYLPNKIRTRWNKQGFLPPQAAWFSQGPLLEKVADLFASQSFRQDSYWDAKWWDSVLKRVRAGDVAIANSMWAPFIISEWKAHFFDRFSRCFSP